MGSQPRHFARRKANSSRRASRAPTLTLSRPSASRSTRHAPLTGVALEDIRLRLAVAMSAAYVVGAALNSQHADSDQDAALVLQRCVGDELGRQIERLDAVIAGGSS